MKKQYLSVIAKLIKTFQQKFSNEPQYLCWTVKLLLANWFDELISPKKSEGKVRRRHKFWIGPLCAGCFFATGHGVTQRLLIMNKNFKELPRVSFQPKLFPGDRLATIRILNSKTQGLLNIDPTSSILEKDLEKLATREVLKEKSVEAPLKFLQPTWISPDIPRINTNWKF